MWATGRTEGHELGPDSDRKYNKVEDFDHLQVRVRPMRNEHRADVEQKCFGEVDEPAGNSMGSPFAHVFSQFQSFLSIFYWEAFVSILSHKYSP